MANRSPSHESTKVRQEIKFGKGKDRRKQIRGAEKERKRKKEKKKKKKNKNEKSETRNNHGETKLPLTRAISTLLAHRERSTAIPIA